MLKQRTKVAKQTEEINSTRKEQQLGLKPKLHSQKRKHHELIDKNMQLEYACATLEKDVKQLKAAAIERGLLKESGGEVEEQTKDDAMEE